MITQTDLKQRFHSETGMETDNHTRRFEEWKDELLLKYMNEEREFKDMIDEIHAEFEEFIEREINFDHE